MEVAWRVNSGSMVGPWLIHSESMAFPVSNDVSMVPTWCLHSDSIASMVGQWWVQGGSMVGW